MILFILNILMKYYFIKYIFIIIFISNNIGKMYIFNKFELCDVVGNYCLRLSLMIENGMGKNVFESLNGKSKLNRELANLCIDDLCVPW